MSRINKPYYWQYLGGKIKIFLTLAAHLVRLQYSITRFPWGNWVALLFLEILQLSIYFGQNPIYFGIAFIIGHIIGNLTAENLLKQSNCNPNSIFFNFECKSFKSNVIPKLFYNIFTNYFCGKFLLVFIKTYH